MNATSSEMTMVVQESGAGSIGRLMELAMARPDFNIESFAQLMEMRERFDALAAKQAFVSAMAEFKRHPPQIVKTKLVGYENKDGTITGYRHASLGDVCNAIVAGFGESGFSHDWSFSQSNNQIAVTCTVTHALGHSKSATLSAGADHTNSKNEIQALGSAVSYLERYTLLGVCGIATVDQADHDGRMAGPEPVAEPNKARQPLSAERFRAALEAIKAGTYTYDQVRAYPLTTAQKIAVTKAEKKARAAAC